MNACSTYFYISINGSGSLKLALCFSLLRHLDEEDWLRWNLTLGLRRNVERFEQHITSPGNTSKPSLSLPSRFLFHLSTPQKQGPIPPLKNNGDISRNLPYLDSLGAAPYLWISLVLKHIIMLVEQCHKPPHFWCCIPPIKMVMTGGWFIMVLTTWIYYIICWIQAASGRYPKISTVLTGSRSTFWKANPRCFRSIP